MGKKISKYNKEFVLIIFAVGILMRLFTLTVPNDMWHDASFNYEFSEMPIKYIVDSNDVHPPLFYIFTKIWQQVSTNEYWLRSFSLVCYIAFFYMLYKYLKKNHNSLTTMITLTFISFSPTIIFYSLEYRNYMLGMFFVIAQLYYFKDYLESSNKEKGYLYVLFSLLMLYTHYFTIFVLPVEFLYLAFKHSRKLVTIFVEPLILIGIWLVPLFIYFIRTLPKMHSMWFKDITLLSFISTLTYQIFPSDTITEFHLIVLFILMLFWAFSFYIKKQNTVFTKKI